MNRLPNTLTVSRIVLTVGFIFFLIHGEMFFAAALFILAALTDFYDGYFAKKHNCLSTFGVIMDPIADKVLILAAFFAFLRLHIIVAWMFYVILIREGIVTVFRLFAMKKGNVLAAEKIGKIKTVLQMTTVSVILVYLIICSVKGRFIGCQEWGPSWLRAIDVLMILTVAVTIFSGVSFLWNNRKNFSS